MIKYNSPIVNPSLKIVYTIRHGESIGNALGLDDNSLKDLPNHKFPLTEKGRRQISFSGEYVAENKLINSDVGLFTSNFLRAQQTLEIVLERQNTENFNVTLDARLDEWWRGIFHSLSEEEYSQGYPLEQKIQSREGRYHFRPLQGQAGKDVEINLLSFLNSVREEEIFLCGHGRSIGMLHRLLTNSSVELNCKYPNPKNGEIWKFTSDGDYFNFESLFIPKIN